MFVLVHGAWHGSWCWEGVEASLGKLGADSIAVDLPGRAGDTRPVDQLTLASYVDSVVAAIDTSPEPVVLVGHSMSGLVISQTAERVPDRVGALVYLCALLLHDGQSTHDVMINDPNSLLLSNITHDDAFTVSSLAPEVVHDLFYADCSAEVSAQATRRLVPEPVGPPATPVHVTAERWGTVPRTYVLCSEDRALSPAKQRTMIADVGVDQVVEIRSSHSPFLSQPERLATLFAEVVG